MLGDVSIKLVGAFWADLSIYQQSLLNALVAAGLGAFVAVSTHDGQSAALLGAAQAALALALGFGVHLDAQNQAVLMGFVSVAVSMFVRTQVTAPVPPAG